MSRLVKIFVVLPALLLVLAFGQKAYAAPYEFDFSFSGAGITSNGTFDASLVSGDRYLVTSIAGTQNGESMTLLAPGAYAGNDNDVFTSGPSLDLGGLAFVLSGGPTAYNIYFDGGVGYLECNSGGGPCNAGVGTPINFTLTTVPEPGSLMLVLSGLAALARVTRRKLLS